jgi:hypothetical protein
MSTDAPEAGTQITIYYDPRHPGRVQSMRWDWERIGLTGVIGVPAGVLYGIGYISSTTSYSVGDAVVPLFGLLSGVLLAAGAAFASVRAHGGARAMFAVAAGIAALSVGHTSWPDSAR